MPHRAKKPTRYTDETEKNHTKTITLSSSLLPSFHSTLRTSPLRDLHFPHYYLHNTSTTMPSGSSSRKSHSKSHVSERKQWVDTSPLSRCIIANGCDMQQIIFQVFVIQA